MENLAEWVSLFIGLFGFYLSLKAHIGKSSAELKVDIGELRHYCDKRCDENESLCRRIEAQSLSSRADTNINVHFRLSEPTGEIDETGSGF